MSDFESGLARTSYRRLFFDFWRTLEDLCCDVVDKFSDYQLRGYLERIGDRMRTQLSNSTSSKCLELPLNLSLLLFTKEKYWQKRCLNMGWTVVHYWFYFCNWKSTYVSLFAEQRIDDFICGKISFSQLETDLLRFKDYLLTLKINGFKLKYLSSNTQKFTAKNDDLLEDYVLRMISMFPNLKELYFNNIPINYELVLDVNGNRFADRSIESLNHTLSTLTTLQKVSLIGTYMKQPLLRGMLESLGCLNNLSELNLSCNLISDDSCDDIAVLLSKSKIQKLILSNNEIGDKGASNLSRILKFPKHLSALYLDQNVIGKEGAYYLAAAIVHNTTLLKLDISYNKVTDKAIVGLCQLIRENISLEYLNLAGNYMGKEAGAKIYSAIRCNNTLKFFGHQFCGFTVNDEDLISQRVVQNYTESQTNIN